MIYIDYFNKMNLIIYDYLIIVSKYFPNILQTVLFFRISEKRKTLHSVQLVKIKLINYIISYIIPYIIFPTIRRPSGLTSRVSSFSSNNKE